MLTLAAVEKTYRGAARSAQALLPVSATIRAGEFVSFVGPSGCGKTTLLKMCAGLIAPSGGQVTYRDTGAPIKPGRYGFVFQNAALLPWRTALENVMLPAVVLGLPWEAATERARRLLDLVLLPHASGSYPNQLSGGMQQRVSIARALLHDPDLLFMDEPFGALDAMTREQLNMDLQRICLDQDKTVLFVTHDIEEAVLLSDRVFVFSRGPGRLVDVLTVPLARPRSLADKAQPGFHESVTRIRALLEQHEREAGNSAAGAASAASEDTRGSPARASAGLPQRRAA